MAITRVTTRVHLRTGIAGESDHVAPVGSPVWIVEWTVRDGRREDSVSTTCAAEAAARRLVENLLANLPPGKTVADVYTEGGTLDRA